MLYILPLLAYASPQLLSRRHPSPSANNSSSNVVQPISDDSAIDPSFPYGSEKVRGVNLGGWLVLEPWITPSIFDNTGNDNIVDEWTFGQYYRSEGVGVLQQHWDTWITESDFAQIASAG